MGIVQPVPVRHRYCCMGAVARPRGNRAVSWSVTWMVESTPLPSARPAY